MNPIATMTMEDGKTIKLELLKDMAPNTVNNFISLVQSGYYDGLIFHRVIKDFMIQGGDPDGIGTGGPGYAIKGEFASNGFAQNTLKHTTGVISMARSMAKNSAGSQFFICVTDTPHLDGQYAAFGRCADTESANNAIAISLAKTDYSDRPIQEQKIKSITVETFNESYPAPDKF